MGCTPGALPRALLSYPFGVSRCTKVQRRKRRQAAALQDALLPATISSDTGSDATFHFWLLVHSTETAAKTLCVASATTLL